MVSEISKAQKDEYCMVSFVCGIWHSSSFRNRVEKWLSKTGRLRESMGEKRWPNDTKFCKTEKISFCAWWPIS
jgi:hypothetical protein